MAKVKIIDSIMGSGKTTAIFNYMKDNPHKKYLYISPFLSEVGDGNDPENYKGRIHKELPELRFIAPKNMGEGKKGTLERLLIDGRNISSTHALFASFDSDTAKLLRDNEYTLIIDEAVDVVHIYDKIGSSDVDVLLSSDMVYTQNNTGHLLHWNYDKYPNYTGDRFADIKNLCDIGCLYLYKDKIVMWELPREVVNQAQETYIMTYLFEGSVMKCWLEFNDVDYAFEDNSSWGLEDEHTIKDIIRDKLHVLNTPKAIMKLDKANTTFSYTWYSKRSTRKQRQDIKNGLVSTVVYSKMKTEDIFWTTFKEFQKEIQGQRYTRAPKDQVQPFVSKSAKATNIYGHKKLCMYTVNIFKNPTEIGYIENKGSVLDENKYALSEMLQFIFRGCIRNHEDMYVLVCSSRMRKLLEEWLSK